MRYAKALMEYAKSMGAEDTPVSYTHLDVYKRQWQLKLRERGIQ